MSQDKINYSIDDYGTLHLFLGNCAIADIQDCYGLSRYKIKKLINDTLYDMGYVWLQDGTVMEKPHHDLLNLLINFTKEDFDFIEQEVMEKLDSVRGFIHYLREGDSDITRKASDKVVDKIVKYLIS